MIRRPKVPYTYKATYQGQTIEVRTDRGIRIAEQLAAAHFKVPSSLAREIHIVLHHNYGGTT